MTQQIAVLEQLPIPTRGQVDEFQAQVIMLPPVDTIQTEHHLHGGVYSRKVFIPKGTVVVGRVHKTAHVFICISGEIKVWSTEAPVCVMTSGDITESLPGVKRVVFTLEDTVIMTVHRVEALTMDELEDEIVEPDSMGKFDFDNRLKPDALPGCASQIQGEIS
jgi:quercetin dioxygenase-like cupin family protein